jgi:thioesterase domain-containing protein
VLGLDQVGRHDNFFELGGHSLLAVKVLDRMRREFDYELPLALIFDGSNVAEISNRISNVKPNREVRRTPLQDGQIVAWRSGTGPALFLFHALEGGLGYYRTLVDHLCNGPPVYGVHAYSPDVAHAQSIPDLASIYADKLCALDLHEPFRLMGYSFGGNVATEVGIRLLEAGRPVDFLGLIDVSARRALPSVPKDDLLQDWSDFVTFSSFGRLTKVPSGLRSPTNRAFAWLAARLEKSGGNFRETSEYGLRDRFEVFRRHQRALKSYTSNVYTGPAVQYKACLSTPSNDVTVRPFGEVWPAADVVSLDCDHLSVLLEPAAALIGSDVAKRLACLNYPEPG